MATKLKSNKPVIKTASNINADVKLAFETITGKRTLYNTLWAYYRGNHPLRYSTERLRKAFDKIGTYFAQNWIAVIIDAVLDRISLKGFNISKDKQAQDRLQEIWDNLSLHLMADDVHESATVVGEGYVIAWKEEVEKVQDTDTGIAEVLGEEVLDVYFNDARMVHLFYDPARPTRKLFAAKMWKGADYYPRLLLYYPDRLEHYISRNKVTQEASWVTSHSSFVPDDTYGPDGREDNPYGIIPVFHFRSGRVSGKREIGQSEISLQDAVNKLFADMMVGSEFYTFAQRVIISQTDPGDLKNGAGVNWYIPAGDGKGQQASVIELGAKSLDNYLHALDHTAQTMAIISRTPKHYLMLNGGDPSGDALLAMEAPLVKKVTKRIQGYEIEWKALAAFLLLLDGSTTLSTVDITPTWEPVTTIQPLASAQTTKTEVEATIPLVTSLRRQGWGTDELEQLGKDQKEERKVKSSLAQEELDRMRAEDAANNTNPDGSPKKEMTSDPSKSQPNS